MVKCSVIIPTYNRGDLIIKAIESVFSQNIKDIEIIVIDDGSLDNTNKKLIPFFDKIIYISIKHTGLPAKVRNAGIRIAKGDYIAFLDSDDIWLPNKLERQIDIFNKNPNIALVCSNAYVFSDVKEFTHKKIYLHENSIKLGFLLDDLLEDNFIITSSCIVNYKLLGDLIFFPEEISFRGIEDYYLWLKIATKFPLYYDPTPLILYRDTSNSIRSEISKINYYTNLKCLYLDIRENILLQNNKFDSSLSIIKKKIENIEYQRLLLYLLMKNYSEIKNNIKCFLKINIFLLFKCFIVYCIKEINLKFFNKSLK